VEILENLPSLRLPLGGMIPHPRSVRPVHPAGASPMYDLLISSALILMVIGPAILTAIQRANSDDLYF
jgi:hypothetical protein